MLMNEKWAGEGVGGQENFSSREKTCVKPLRKVRAFKNFGQTVLGRREARDKT